MFNIYFLCTGYVKIYVIILCQIIIILYDGRVDVYLTHPLNVFVLLQQDGSAASNMPTGESLLFLLSMS